MEDEKAREQFSVFSFQFLVERSRGLFRAEN
jgi:hypothetical protein